MILKKRIKKPKGKNVMKVQKMEIQKGG